MSEDTVTIQYQLTENVKNVTLAFVTILIIFMQICSAFSVCKHSRRLVAEHGSVLKSSIKEDSSKFFKFLICALFGIW